ncbi:hypothetical protein E4U52_002073 [Claviceps spartinae]|nr:hypothetical protein E4U52_002073 [Claviceps spartinae]
MNASPLLGGGRSPSRRVFTLMLKSFPGRLSDKQDTNEMARKTSASNVPGIAKITARKPGTLPEADICGRHDRCLDRAVHCDLDLLGFAAGDRVAYDGGPFDVIGALSVPANT